MNARLPDLLHDLASEMSADVERSSRRVVRRARGRRVATALVASAMAVAVVVGGVSALRLVSTGTDREPIVPLPPGPDAVFAGLWPETSADALAQAQARVDEGHDPLRVDPAQTAVMLATNVFAWEHDATRPSVVHEEQARATVELRNADLSEDLPSILVEVARLGRTGPGGVWSVVGVSSPLFESTIRVDAAADGGRGSITFQGSLTGVLTRATIRFDVRRGPNRQASMPAGDASLDGRAFTGSIGSWPDDTLELEGAVLWVQVVDPANRALGATAVPLTGTDAPISGPTATAAPEAGFTDLPPGVAVTAQRILDAVEARDVDALAELVDPSTFSYNFGDEGDPVAAWREDPSVLDAIPAVLALPPTVEALEGSPDLVVWPYLMAEGALEDVSEQEGADLHALGFSDRDVEQMREFGGYLGPRLAIDERGAWRYYVTGGD